MPDTRQEPFEDEVPFVAVANGERAPWADEPLTCPECGEPCELKDSNPPGLTFISCCGKQWLRGTPNLDALFGGAR